MNKHFVLAGLVASVVLLMVAAAVYPGGNWADPQAVGFDWTKNFISNLFQPKAMNGADSSSPYWADVGMIVLALSFAAFFWNYASRLPQRSAQNVTRWSGVAAMVSMALVVTPMHDAMVALSSTFFLLSLFYITVFILRSDLHLFKFLCVACLAVSYFTLYLYGTGRVENLAVMQKVTVICLMGLTMGLQYFTGRGQIGPAHGNP